MPDFRGLPLPAHRPNRKACKKYASYLKTLRTDFHRRCGYCNDHDQLRIRSYTIDHFVPQNPDGWIHTIPDNYYYNLIYSCRYCNSAKSNKWPTQNSAIANNGTHGFIDPCTQAYTDAFTRTHTGKIIPVDSTNLLTKYVFEELQLWLPIHEKMWKLERIKVLNEAVKQQIANMPGSNLRKILKELHYEILSALDEVQSSIFMEND